MCIDHYHHNQVDPTTPSGHPPVLVSPHQDMQVCPPPPNYMLIMAITHVLHVI